MSLIAKGIVSVSLVGMLAFFLDSDRVWETLWQVRASQLWLAAAGGGLGLVVQWIKWRGLLSCVRPGTTAREGLRSLLAGFAVGLFSPARIGELSRGLFLPSRRLASSAAAAVDRLCSFAVTLLAGAVSLIALRPGAGIVAVTGVLAIGLLGLRWLSGHRGRAIGEGRLAKYAARRPILFELAAALHRMPGSLWLRTLAWSVLFNLVFFTQFFILLGSTVEISLSVLATVPVIFSLKALLPAGLMDLGVREASAVFVFRWLGWDPAPAFNAALLVYVINVLVPGLLGVLFVGGSTGSVGYARSLRRPSHGIASCHGRDAGVRQTGSPVETGV